jgi:hypothetical protein
MQLEDMQIFKNFPPRIKELHNGAGDLIEKLDLQYIDSSTFLVPIIALGQNDSSARWLMSIGLSEEVIVRFVRSNNHPRQYRLSLADWFKRRPAVPDTLAYTPAARRMFSFLAKAKGTHLAADLYVGDVLDAIVRSQSDIVRKIFHSVGYAMPDVRSILNIVDDDDIEDLFHSA